MTRAQDTSDIAFTVAGLRASVEIRIDHWGIPHIVAEDRADVFIAQGFNAARDRLFQIDLWRRRGHGRLAEVWGAAAVEQDRANRLMLYRGDMEAEWAAYGPGARAAIEAFVVGINAYVAWARDDTDRLPPEFAVHDYLPDFWKAEDVVRFRTHGLFYNVEQEIARAQTLVAGGEVADELRQKREPAHPRQVPEGVDLTEFSEEMLRTYRLAFAPAAFAEAAAPESAVEGVSGSNNWVVDGSRTSTGRPILANDPHRAITLPSLRYLAHLRAPGLNVVGAGEPGLPGISIGHNETLAFGLTIWPADVEDLYVYRCDDTGAGDYVGPDGPARFATVEETIGVRGAEDATVTLAFTVHGPVIHVDHDRGIVIALRAAWLEPGMAPYVASLGYGDAPDGESFIAALEHWGAPAVNQVFATVDGDWGWQVAAKVPRRDGWDGSLPVPGTGAYEWRGLVGAPELPGERRPERGWIATANECNLPEDWIERGITATHDWYSDARALRLREWLSSDDRVSVATSDRMQNDFLSVHACAVIANLAGVRVENPRVDAELTRLRDWSGVESVDSREALVFEIWVRRHLRPAIVRERLAAEGVPAERIDAVLPLVLKDESFGGDLRGDLSVTAWLGAHVDGARVAAIVERTVCAALDELEQMLGAETEASPWSWGRLHHASVTHPALAAASALPAEWVRQGPIARGGSGDTVGNAGYDAAFRQSIGSTFRMVLDVGDWDRSVAMNSPGQSGDPRSEHYGDLFAGWAEGESFPLLFSDEEIAQHTAQVIRLHPDEEVGERTSLVE